jgi:hypothetical protein
VPDDVVALHQLMGSASNALELQEAFLHAVGVSCCSLTCCGQQSVLPAFGFPQHNTAHLTCVRKRHKAPCLLSNMCAASVADCYAGRQGAVVAAVNGELVAMLASDPCSPETLDSWSAQFRLGAALPCSCLQAPEQHAQVSACVINPVFAAQAGTLLAGAQGESPAQRQYACSKYMSRHTDCHVGVPCCLSPTSCMMSPSVSLQPP